LECIEIAEGCRLIMSSTRTSFPCNGRLRVTSVIAVALAALTLPGVARADTAPLPVMPARADNATARFGDALRAINAGQWDSARTMIDAIDDRALAAFARAELYLAANSPRVEADALVSLLGNAPNLPQAQQLARLAQRRGVTSLPTLPPEQRLAWAGGSPRRGNPRTVVDPAATDIARNIPARITADDPAGAEALLNAVEARLSPESLTEWRARVAWAYYIENDDGSARRLAALAQTGRGDWVANADWTQGLASWRQADCTSAMAAFRNVAGRAEEPELEASGHFWFARAATACGQPREAQPALRRAAALDETFYGLIAAEALGISARALGRGAGVSAHTADLPNVRLATILASVGDTARADEVLRYQARIGVPEDHAGLLAVAQALSLPETQLYLAHNAPGGMRPEAMARFPAPAWAPANGWRVNPALVYAHTLQESQFRTRAVSPAGAVGLMQVRRGTGNDMGLASYGGDLTNPAVNMALGQAYIEFLRDNGATNGQLPRVIAAYNAGPAPVARWATEVHDNGDPLLFIESIPYWETRAYVGTVLRNMWMYERQLGVSTDSRRLMAQGQWPRVPTANDAVTQRLAANALPRARGN
jgi:soluble lytic murein transglycosylase